MTRPKNVFLISIDDLRFDAISCEDQQLYLKSYGLKPAETPQINLLAEHGVRFAQAIATAPYTPASHTSIFTGLFPPRHGIRKFLGSTLSPNIPTLTELFKANGYTTMMAIDFHQLFELTGLTRNLDHFVRCHDDDFFALLAREVAAPKFCFVHLGDIHPPYGESFCPATPEENEDFYTRLLELAKNLGIPHGLPASYRACDRKDLIDLDNRIRLYCEEQGMAAEVFFPRYLAGVHKFDQGRFSRFVHRLRAGGHLQDSLMVIFSDHGQAPLSRAKMINQPFAKFDHGETVVEELIRVPLIFYGPGMVPENVVIKNQVSLVDIFPTILELCEIPVAENLEDLIDGRSLVGLIHHQEFTRDFAYAEVWYYDRAKLSAYFSKCKEVGRLLPPEYDALLYEKCLRTETFKYIVRGDEVTARDLAGSAEDVVKILSHKVLARFATRELLFKQATRLRSGQISPQGLVDEFRRGHFSREQLFSLPNDPLERMNLLAVEASEGGGHYREIAAALHSQLGLILAKTVTDATIGGRASPDEIQSITDKLVALGYI